MTEAGALVEELKRLTLENERLKAWMVSADAERELHPLPSKGSFIEYHPESVTIPVGLTDHYDIDFERKIRRQAFAAMAVLLMERVGEAASWGSLDPLGNSFRLQAWVGLPRSGK